MRKHIIPGLVLLFLPLVTEAQLRVFACEPEWAALATEIAGDLVETSSATNALQDPHYIQARPSLIAKVRRADLLVCSGAQLEIGWLPMLLRKGNNPDVMPGSEGYLEASLQVNRLGATGGNDRSQGDVHPEGNPHIQVNPHNILLVARALAERMSRLDPPHAGRYASGLEQFSQRWSSAIDRWQQRGAVLRGKKVITHHKSWIYLQDWLGLEEMATLEPISGIPPTAGHLGKLLNEFRDESGADFIIRAPYQSEKASEWLSNRTGIPAVMLPLSVGGSSGASDLFSLYDDILDRLLNAGKQ